VAAALAAKFPNVAVAESNQAVLDGSDVAMLAIRPQVTVEVLSDLKFRPDHQVISLMAITPLEKVSTLVAPASKVVRAIPMPMVAHLCGPTAIYPPDPIRDRRRHQRVGRGASQERRRPDCRLRRVGCSPAADEGGPVSRLRAQPTPSYNGPRSSPLA
jgi:hypothetical protein